MSYFDPSVVTGQIFLPTAEHQPCMGNVVGQPGQVELCVGPNGGDCDTDLALGICVDSDGNPCVDGYGIPCSNFTVENTCFIPPTDVDFQGTATAATIISYDPGTKLYSFLAFSGRNGQAYEANGNPNVPTSGGTPGPGIILVGCVAVWIFKPPCPPGATCTDNVFFYCCGTSSATKCLDVSCPSTGGVAAARFRFTFNVTSQPPQEFTCPDLSGESETAAPPCCDGPEEFVSAVFGCGPQSLDDPNVYACIDLGTCNGGDISGNAYTAYNGERILEPLDPDPGSQGSCQYREIVDSTVETTIYNGIGGDMCHNTTFDPETPCKCINMSAGTYTGEGPFQAWTDLTISDTEATLTIFYDPPGLNMIYRTANFDCLLGGTLDAAPDLADPPLNEVDIRCMPRSITVSPA